MNYYVRMRLLPQRLHSEISNTYATTYKYLFGDKVHSRDPHTFQSRIIDFFEKAIIETNSKNEGSNESIRDFSRSVESNKNTPNLAKLSNRTNHTKELKVTGTSVVPLINSMQSLEKIKNTKDASTLLNDIDQQCCSLLDSSSSNDILLLLNTMTKMVPHRITRMIFYSKSIEKLGRAMEAGLLTTREIVHLLFLIGFKKKLGTRDVEIVMQHLPEMDKLSLMEKCIVAQTTFKSSVQRLMDKEVKSIEETIEKNAQQLVQDPALLVTLCKVLRYSGPTDECSLENLSKKLVRSKRRYELPTAAHVLALYAKANIADAEVLSRLINDSMLTMRNKPLQKDSRLHFSIAFRIKDVDRLLSAASRLNHKFDNSDIIKINEYVGEKLEEFFKEPELLVNTLLSMWMLGFKCQAMLEKCFERDIFTSIELQHWRDKKQLDLLLSCIRIEAPHVKIPIIPVTGTNVRWHLRHTVLTVETALNCLSDQTQLHDIKVECPIKGLDIAGISTNHPFLGWIHIDVLDETTCLRNTDKPHGLMNLKLRLLRKLGCWSVVIRKFKDECLEDSYAILEDSINNLLQNDEIKP